MAVQTDWVEYEDGPEKDSAGSTQVARVFKIWNAEEHLVTTNPTSVVNLAGVPLPGYNTAHPRDADARLDRWTVRREGTVLVASAFYSSDRRFRFPTPLVPQSGSFADSHFTQVVPIPYGKRSESIVTWSGGSVIQRFYDEKVLNVPHAFQRVTITFEYENYGLTASRAIARQVDKLHRLIGPPSPQWYLFEGAQVTSSGSNTSTISYSWSSDPGTPEPPSVPTATDPEGKLVIYLPTWLHTWEGVEYIRRPFHTLFFIRNQVDPDGYPTFEDALLKDLEPDGHLTLPGYT